MGKNNRKIKGNETWILLVCYIVLLTMILAFAASCSPHRRLANLERKHPQLLLQFCDSKAINDTQVFYTPGHWVDSTSILMPAEINIYKHEPMPTNITGARIADTSKKDKKSKQEGYANSGRKHIFIPPTKTIIVKQIDTSGKALLRSENSDLLQQKDKLQGKLSAWQFWAIFGYIIVIILAVIVGIFLKWK